MQPDAPFHVVFRDEIMERSRLPTAITRGHDHIVSYANPAFCRLLGRDRTMVEGRRVSDVLGHDITPTVSTLLDEVYRTGLADGRGDVVATRRDGDPVSCALTVSAQHGDCGRELRVQLIDTGAPTVGSIERARSARAVRQANAALLVAGLHAQELADQARMHAAQMSALLDGMGEGVVVFDPDGRVVLMNPIARTLFAITDDAPTLAHFRRCEIRRLDTGPMDFESDLLSRTLLNIVPHEIEFSLLRPGDARRRRILCNGSVVRDARGEVTLALHIYRDVTELRDAEQAREEYLGLISHDLRSPMTAIVALGGWLRRTLATEDREREVRAVDNILRSAQRMDAMIGNLLESTQFESGQIRLERHRLDLSTLVGELTERVGSLEDRARLDVVLAESATRVSADVGLIERALTNLVNNALKYSAAPARVQIVVEVRDRDAVVAVHDHGTGISAKELPEVFEKFRRVGNTARTRGSGLGLYITRLIAEAHGGRVWADSTLGKGSSFYLAIPLATEPV